MTYYRWLEVELFVYVMMICRLFNANPTDVGARCSGYLYDGDDFAGTIYANAVSIRWQSTDFTTPTMTSTTIKPKTSSIARNTSTQSPEAPLESHGLTIGAKAGIGVGVSLGVILTIGLALWLFYARRKRSQSPPQGHDEPDHMTENVVIYETLPVELPTPTYFTTELPTPRSGSPPSKPAELASS
ncbi:hypothetical protein PENANT_c023G04554 [Penicillium antarcticum]|uniref:Mid2 domain-containing protein n=1 Tax=Penicillium antarcticum TaxID=416450 RepID=A0A1V6PYU4_9EURO|nr:uncharacterized protein N7508_006227 [Penicillium antarcticum]KAJ5301364.1 hypothetical protein N7508_006227 [Penicillium antarcticum]OQD82105.1 hypothetical protein PENANT_c023G04554 [Penicillium antarcticum]